MYLSEIDNKLESWVENNKTISSILKWVDKKKDFMIIFLEGLYLILIIPGGTLESLFLFLMLTLSAYAFVKSKWGKAILILLAIFAVVYLLYSKFFQVFQ